MMNLQFLTKEDFQQLYEKMELIQKDLSMKHRNPKDVIYDSNQLMKMLNISASTLQKLRDNGIIGFSKVQGKLYYRQIDVNEMIERNYYPPYKVS